MLRQSEESDMRRPGGGLLLNGDYTEVGTGADLLHDDFVADENGRPVVAVSLTGDGDSDRDGARDRDGEISTWAVVVAGSVLFGPGFQYLRADRITPR